MRPAEVRAMPPRDFSLVVDGWNDAHKGNAPGANAPTRAEVNELVKKYG